MNIYLSLIELSNFNFIVYIISGYNFFRINPNGGKGKLVHLAFADHVHIMKCVNLDPKNKFPKCFKRVQVH